MRDPYALCQNLLTQVVEQMTSLGSTLPTTQYVAPGQTVAYDGEQVTANILRVFAGHPGAEDAVEYAGFVYTSIEMMVVIVRDSPTLQDVLGGDPAAPSAAALQANAQLMAADVQNLTQALVNIRDSNVLGTGGMPVHIGPVMTVGPEGGVVAVTGQFAMPLL